MQYGPSERLRLGLPGNYIYTFDLNDTDSVVFSRVATGAPNASTASVDRSNLNLVADDNHRFTNPAQPRPQGPPRRQIPSWDFIQTDGDAIYFHGSDFSIRSGRRGTQTLVLAVGN